MGLRVGVGLPGPLYYSTRAVPRSPRFSGGEAVALVVVMVFAGVGLTVAAAVHHPWWALGIVFTIALAVGFRRWLRRREAQRDEDSRAVAMAHWQIAAAPADAKARAWIREQYGRDPVNEDEVLVVGTERFGMPLRPGG